MTYFGPFFFLLQDDSKFGADVDVAHVVQQNPDHLPSQVHDAGEAHELAELERGWMKEIVFFTVCRTVKRKIVNSLTRL